MAMPGPAEDVSSKKLAAGICGILLGGFGIHKFVLGYTQEALIMLILSLCCIPYPIFQIIGIIEGVIYLTKTDADFYQTYIVGRKGWF